MTLARPLLRHRGRALLALPARRRAPPLLDRRAASLLVVLPYNYVNDRVHAAHGRTLSPTLAFSDQVLVVAVLAFVPELVAAVLLVCWPSTPPSAVAFGRRIAAEAAAAVGALGMAGVLLVDRAARRLALRSSSTSSARPSSSSVVGGSSEIEREVRGPLRRAHGRHRRRRVGAAHATARPRSTSTAAPRSCSGYPVGSWRQPGFWADHVHPDDREWVSRALRRRGRGAADNTEIEYRFIAADGRVVHLHDRMRVEVGRQRHASAASAG